MKNYKYECLSFPIFYRFWKKVALELMLIPLNLRMEKDDLQMTIIIYGIFEHC